MEDLYNKVEKGDPEIASCDWMECKTRGQYIRCYFNDLFIICPMYLTHRNYLKTIQEMGDQRKFKGRKDANRRPT